MTFEQFLAALSATERAAYEAMSDEAKAAFRASFEADEAARTLNAARERMTAPAVRTARVGNAPEPTENGEALPVAERARAFATALKQGRVISTDDNSAGALTPDEWVPEIMTGAKAATDLLSADIVQVRNMTRESLTFQVRGATIKSSRNAIGEGTAPGGADASWKSVHLVAKKFGNNLRINEEVFADSPHELYAELGDQISEDIGVNAEAHILIGQGGDAQPQGIATHDDVPGVPGPAFNGDAEAYAKALDLALNTLFFGFKAGYRRSKRFAFVCDPRTYGLLNSLRVGGVKVLSAPTDQKPFATLFGKPVIESDALSTEDNTGRIVVGDYSKYVFGMRRDLTVQTAAAGGEAFEADQVAIKYRTRYDGKVAFPDAFRVLTVELPQAQAA